MEGPGLRDPARRGLLLIAWGLAIAVALSLTGTFAIEWVIRRARDSSEGYESLFETIRTISWGRTAGAVLTGLMMVAGCWLLSRADRAGRWRMWATVAMIGGGLRIVFGLSMAVLGQSEPGMALRVTEGVESLVSLAFYGAMGLAVRGLITSRGSQVSAAASTLWLIGLALEAFQATMDFAKPGWLYGEVGFRYLIYGIAMAIILSRSLILFAARRQLGRLNTAGDVAWPASESESFPAAADGLALYRGALLARVAIACVGLAAVGIGLASQSQSSLAMVGLLLPIAEMIAAIAMVVGLLRYAANSPREADASGGAIAGVVFMVLSGVIQLYGYTIAWRIHMYNQAASGATGMWDVPAIGDLFEVAKRLPWIELAATSLALLGLCLVLGSLRSLARWQGRRDLETRTAFLTAGMAVLVCMAAGLRWYLASARRPSLELVVMLAIATLAGALVLFVQKIGLLGELIAMLRGQRRDLPDARVVSGGEPPV
jgi:hypothetical protein